MGLARDLERRLERLVEGTAGAVFRGAMHPVEIADRLVRQLDFMVEAGPGGERVPNRLTVRLHPGGLDVRLDPTRLARELVAIAEEAAADRGWRLEGPVTVELVADPSVPRGILHVDGHTEPGRRAPWGHLVADDASFVAPLTDNRIVVGRALDCDVILAVPEVSRHHAVVLRRGGKILVADLGSANGTRVNGEPVGAEPHPVVPGDTVELATVACTVTMA